MSKFSIIRVKARLAHLPGRNLAPMRTPYGTRQHAHQVRRQAHGLAHIAHRALVPVADHRGRQGGAVAAITGIDILDHLFAPLMLEIHIDVGRLAPLGGKETLEQQIHLGGINRGDTQQIADHGIGRRAPALTENPLRSGKLDDVMDGQEIWRVVQLADQTQFMAQHGRDFFGYPLRKTHFRPFPGQVMEMRVGGGACRDRLVGVIIT